MIFGLTATLIAIAFLLMLSGFFSGSETALTAASRARLHGWEKQGDGGARIANVLIADRERLIGAILLGNNLVNILASALATVAFVQMFGEAGVAYATAAMTALVVIFSEVLPKSYALSNADRFATTVARPIQIIVFLFAPIVAAVRFIVRLTLGIFGIKVEGDALDAHEEIRGAVDLHHHEGGVVKHDRDMLGGVLDLRDLTVEDVMVHRKNMNMLDLAKTAEELVDEALDSAHTRLPAYEDDAENIVGVLHAKDLSRALRAVGGDLSQIEVRDVTREPWFVPETTSLLEQLNAFRRKREHFALVVDEYGALMGLITLEDILEEIVGETEDEHDERVQGLKTQGDGSVIAEGSVPIRDLNRAMDWNLPDEEAVTIAGLVIHEAQTIPETGQIFAFHDHRFEVLKRQRNQITLLRISPAPEPDFAVPEGV